VQGIKAVATPDGQTAAALADGVDRSGLVLDILRLLAKGPEHVLTRRVPPSFSPA
jgi:hypothetical protein